MGDGMAKGDSTARWAGLILTKTRSNARRRGIELCVTKDDIANLIRAQGHRCAVTGLKFDETPRDDGGRVRPFIPSLDRINSRGPYTIDNVRVVCAGVNAALGDWGDEVFGLFAVGYCERMGWSAVPCKRKYPRGVVGRPHENGVRYEAQISWGGKRWYLGTFDSPEQGGEYYRRALDGLMAGDEIGKWIRKNSRQRGIDRRKAPIHSSAVDGM